MSASSSTLPSGWSDVLAEIQHKLDQARDAAHDRLARSESAYIPPSVPVPRPEMTRLQDCLQGLSLRLEAVERLVQEVDGALQTGEHVLRQQKVLCGSVRQKLAAWAGRAIG